MKRSSLDKYRGSMIEPLEARIAPATVAGTTVPYSYLAKGYTTVSVTVGGALLMHAGEVLTTGTGSAGTYLLWDQQGEMLVFTTDLNHDGKLEPNEITGIAAGNGLKMTAFCDINGDIVTNLNADGTLTNSNPSKVFDPDLKGNGGVLLDNTIAGITLRSLTQYDQINDGSSYLTHVSITSYSIHGSILAGGGFGDGTASGGLIIDSSGLASQQSLFGGAGASGNALGSTLPTPSIGDIMTGTAASGHAYFFTEEFQGTIANFVVPIGEHGGDIIGIQAVSTSMHFNLAEVHAGDGGFGARGGNISGVLLPGVISGGYALIAGNGGAGANGGAGGNISMSDFGSNASVVVVDAGNGGQGLSGTGGVGGTITFGTMDLFAISATFQMGSGGDGLGNGGAGGSLPTATFNIPTISTSVGTVTSLVSSTRSAGEIGTSDMIDFNSDGNGDAVWTTSNPDQVIVGFGDGNGGFTNLETLNINAPAAEVVVGDFNGDGLPDIAVVSASAGSFSGITVFLNHGTTNGWNYFLDKYGFASDAIQTPIPSLTFDATAEHEYTNGPVAVTQIVTGDFNGDLKLDLGLDLTEQVSNFSTNTTVPHQVLMMLNGDGNGHFFGDFGTADSTHPYFDFTAAAQNSISGTATMILKATALEAGNSEDVLIQGDQGGKNLFVVGYPLSGNGPTITTVNLGQVDTNRLLPENGSNNISTVDAQMLDFTVTDINQDQYADLVVLTQTPAEFLVTFEGAAGSGTGDPTFGGHPASDPYYAGAPAGGSVPQGTDAHQNSGIYLGDGSAGGIDGNNGTHNYVAITAADPTHAANTYTGPVSDINGVAILDYTDSKSIVVEEINFEGQFYQGTLSTGADAGAPDGSGNPPEFQDTIHYDKPDTVDTSVVGFDFYQATGTQTGYGIISPTSDSSDAYYATVQFAGDAFQAVATKSTMESGGFEFFAGDGGNSQTKSGGAGGFIGGSLASDGSSGAITIHEPASTSPQVATLFQGGDGGYGLINGGKGGSVSGIYIDYADNTSTEPDSLVGGNGGNGTSGSGGNGGNAFDSETGAPGVWSGGSGGAGYTGGNGGSVLGNNISGVSDTAGIPELFGGDGGHGIKSAGNGGSIQNFVATIHILGLTSTKSELYYEAGSGGSAVAGPGGNGGSIINSSPSSQEDDLDGQIRLVAGDGGAGLTGGTGGSINDFINNASLTHVPLNLYAVAGEGGAGISGNGGTGGSINTLSVDALGLVGSLNQLPFSSVLAGAGGDSEGASGGNGGSLTNVTSIAESSSAGAAAAGAGGNGLIKGGTGGSVENTTVNAAAAIKNTKVLVVAGDGGSGLASLSVDSTSGYDNMLAFGGVDAHGGNGGSITNFTQPTSVQVDADLIAGNGGNTPNYGSPLDASSNVGSGGSISNVSVAGNIGNPDPTVAIKAYNITYSGDTLVTSETMNQFVTDYLRYGVIDPNTGDYYGLTDSLGNVGIQVGAAGTVKGGLPAADATNGSLSDVSARNIMSAVAGSVDNISAIHSISGITITIGNGFLGANKTVDQFGNPSTSGADYTAGLVQYYAQDENPNEDPTSGVIVNTPQLGGTLIDGAIVADNVNGLTGERVFTE